MTLISRHLFDAVAKDLPCYVLMHPGTKSCLKAGPSIYKAALIGSTKFYFLMYAGQFLMQCRNMNKKQLIKIAKDYARSIIMTTLVTAAGFQLTCLLRHVTGKFSYDFFVTLPFALSGLGLCLERPSRRVLCTTVYSNLMIEYILRCLERAGYLSITKTKQVLMFMLGSSMLLYLMRLEKEKEKQTSVLWLIRPEKVRRKSNGHSNICSHDGECRKHVLKHIFTYFGIGLAASLAKLIIPRLKTPTKAISSIRGKHLQFALFLGSYVGIYKALICYLCRRNGNDSALYAVPGGYAAGLSMLFSPNLNLAIAPFTEIFKLLSTTLYEKKYLPSNIPLSLILFCFCQSMLYNARMLDAEACPRYIFYVVNSATNGILDSLYRDFIANFSDTLKKF